MGRRIGNLWTLKIISRLLDACKIDLPREHRRMITLIANATNLRLAAQCAREMHLGRLAKLSRKKSA